MLTSERGLARSLGVGHINTRRNLVRVRQFTRLLVPALYDRELAEEHVRRRLFISIASLTGIPVLLFLSLVDTELRVYLGTGAILLTVTFLTTRQGKAELPLARLSMVYISCLCLYTVSLERDPHEFLYLLIVPMLAVFIFGVIEGTVWSAVFLLLVLTMGAGNLPGLEAVSAVGFHQFDLTVAYLVVYLLTVAFESLRMRSRRLADNAVARLQAQFNRVSEANRERDHIENRLVQYARLASDWLFELDDEFRFTYLSSRFQQVSGIPAKDFIGVCLLDMLDFYEDCDAEAHRQRLLRHEAFRDFRYSFVIHSGERRFVMTRGEPTFDAEGNFSGYLGSGTDVTAHQESLQELRDRDRTLHHVQRLDAIGQLTSGIAHDFNNLLMVITGNAELLRSGVQTGRKELLEAISTAADQAVDLTSKLLSFSRDQPMQTEAVAVNELFQEVTRLLRRSLGEGIELRLDVPETLPALTIDRGQLESAIINLAINSRDAMDGQGVLTLGARQLTESDQELVEFFVTDEGCGIPAAMISRVVEPFFSTKPQGKGTGLGLSMVYGFAKQCGGDLLIDSEENVGTTIRLQIPYREQPDNGMVQVRRDPGTSELLVTMNILVVEDQDHVSDIVLRMLKLLRQNAETCNSAEEALALMETISFDLVITDIMLGPGMDGVDLAEQVNERYPSTQVLLMSGFPERLMNNDAASPYPLLRKPFNFSDLTTALMQIMQDETRQQA